MDSAYCRLFSLLYPWSSPSSISFRIQSCLLLFHRQHFFLLKPIARIHLSPSRRHTSSRPYSPLLTLSSPYSSSLSSSTASSLPPSPHFSCSSSSLLLTSSSIRSAPSCATSARQGMASAELAIAWRSSRRCSTSRPLSTRMQTGCAQSASKEWKRMKSGDQLLSVPRRGHLGLAAAYRVLIAVSLQSFISSLLSVSSADPPPVSSFAVHAGCLSTWLQYQNWCPSCHQKIAPREDIADTIPPVEEDVSDVYPGARAAERRRAAALLAGVQ